MTELYILIAVSAAAGIGILTLIVALGYLCHTLSGLIASLSLGGAAIIQWLINWLL